MLDLSSLNPAQLEAVRCTDGPLLVLAGAGSGKTRVLTYRIAHLIEDLGVSPYEVLAVTFTNKAAAEMRERLATLVPRPLRGMWVSTFHSMCVRMLRRDADKLGFTSSFTIYDADDSKRLVKSIMAELGYDTKRFPDAGIRSRISNAKNELTGPAQFSERAGDPFEKCAGRVYEVYQERLQRANAMDFDDLLFNGYLLLKNHSDVREAYGARFRYVMVDEYQDTNRAQYLIAQLIAQYHGNLMVVGDDDQSIYSWRGADIRNILDFERDWPGAHTVKLEQNYRSTGTILDAANAVIAHNEGRKSKRLFTEAGAGEKVSLYCAADERDEGRWIGSEVEVLHNGGISYNDIAVFYRTNAQSRTLEDMLLRAGVPYRIVGGTRFFDRMEVRDVMAYLKLVVNPADDVSARRVINTPKRGVGKTTVECIAQTASLLRISFLEAAREEVADPACRAAARKSITSFLDIIEEASTYRGTLFDVVSMIVEKSGLVAALQAARTDEAAGRIENIHEFLSVVREYEESHEPSVLPLTGGAVTPNGVTEGVMQEPAAPISAAPTLADFMEWLSLRTDLDSLGSGGEEAVTLMTVHSAKGLEFDNVFVAGLEESIFPHMNSVLEHGVEEERRLAYVAITRARKRLYLTHAQTRRSYQGYQANPRSRFIDEIPEELVKPCGIGSLGLAGFGWEKRGDRRGISGSGTGSEVYGGRVFGSGGHVDAHKVAQKERGHSQTAGVEFAPGDRVEHKTFGPGVVKEVDGDKLTIHFAKRGTTKKLLKGYAPLVKVGD